MFNWLFNNGPSNLGMVGILVILCVLFGAAYWRQHRRWQQKKLGLQTALNQARQQEEQLRHDLAEAQRQHSLDEAKFQAALQEAQRQHSLDEVKFQAALQEAQAKYDPVRIRELQDHLQRVIAHEFIKGLEYIRAESEQMAAGLGTNQAGLRRRINGVEAKCYDMIQHITNILDLPNLQRDAMQRNPVNLQRLLQEVMRELLPYAQVRGIELRAEFGGLEPIFVSKPLIVQVVRNVIHNAIKYTPKDSERAVDITSYLGGDDVPQAIVDVRDHGDGIEIKEQAHIFELNERGDGLLEPGNGLGLHHARTIARLHGGDVILVESTRDGTLFRIILPYDEPQGPSGERA